MKFLIDENVGHSLINYLKQKKFDLLIVSEELTGRDDIYLMKRPYTEKRIIITNDKDFGYLYYRIKLPSCGIILFRFKDESVKNKINAMDYILKLGINNIYNHFIVASEYKIRIRLLNKKI